MKRIQTVQHLVVGVTMAFAGYNHLRASGSIHVIAVLELLAAATLFGAIVFQQRLESLGSHSRFGWIEIASGALLFVEGASKGTHKLIRPQYLSGLVLIVLGVLEAQLSRRRRRRRSLEATAEMLRARLGFRGFAVPWQEIADAVRDRDRLMIRRRDGREHVIRLRILRNGEEAAEWTFARLRERGIVPTGVLPSGSTDQGVEPGPGR